MISFLKKAVAVGVLIGIVAVGCKDDSPGDMGSPSNVVFPPDSVSYLQHVQPLFDQTCALSGCHDAGAPPERVKLTSWGETVIQMPGIVVPGNPGNSELVLRIQGTTGQRMPLNRNPLNDNQINGIRVWIAEGAQQN